MYLKNDTYRIFNQLDKWLVFFYMTLLLFGWINLYSVSEEKAFKQLIWIGLNIFLIPFLFVLKPVDYKYYSFIFYLISLFLLAGVLFLGKEINGAKSWYSLGVFSFQPVELAKIGTSLALSDMISKPGYFIGDKKNLFSIILILFLPIFFILLQPDPGSVLVFCSFFLVLYKEGLHLGILLLFPFLFILFLFSIYLPFWIVLSALGVLFFFFIRFQKGIRIRLFSTLIFIMAIGFTLLSPILFEKVLKGHHRDRINIIFQNEFDQKYRNNIGYNLLYSKTAIGSGELLGKGYQKGTITKGKFVPEQHTDYIFCTIGEEWGFLGSLGFIIVYLLFIGRIYQLAEKQNDPFSKVLGYCLGSILFFHFFINLSMVMGLMPTIGIPLPFFSYGGSSLWAFTFLVFLFIRLDASDKELR